MKLGVDECIHKVMYIGCALLDHTEAWFPCQPEMSECISLAFPQNTISFIKCVFLFFTEEISIIQTLQFIVSAAIIDPKSRC